MASSRRRPGFRNDVIMTSYLTLVNTDLAEALRRVSWGGRRGCDRCSKGQGTILEIGISSMSVAPAVFSSGINLFTPRLSTTASIAYPPPANGETVGAFIEGTTASTASL